MYKYIFSQSNVEYETSKHGVLNTYFYFTQIEAKNN